MRHTVGLSEEMLAAVRHLRQTARLRAGNQRDADNIVEETFKRALGQVRKMPPDIDLLTWLEHLMEQSFQ